MIKKYTESSTTQNKIENRIFFFAFDTRFERKLNGKSFMTFYAFFSIRKNIFVIYINEKIQINIV
jgi:hypothetical protein